MARLGPYSYPDIRFGDAVEIAGRILSKFKGTVSVKGLAWELGMAEGSGTLFAKVAALRDFGLVEGRGELRISPMAQRVLHPANADEARRARAEAFQRVELLRRLYNRFEGEVPDDASLLIGLEEITKASRDEIVRRAPLLQKHLADAVRTLGRVSLPDNTAEYSEKYQKVTSGPMVQPFGGAAGALSEVSLQEDGGLLLLAGSLRLAAPLKPEFIDAAMRLLATVKAQLLAAEGASPGGERPVDRSVGASSQLSEVDVPETSPVPSVDVTVG